MNTAFAFGRRGCTRTTRGRGGGPIWMPMEICVAKAEPLVNSSAANNVVRIRCFM